MSFMCDRISAVFFIKPFFVFSENPLEKKGSCAIY